MEIKDIIIENAKKANYHINTSGKFKNGGRSVSRIISIDEFIEELKKKAADFDGEIYPEVVLEYTPSILKDLGKIEFDYENTEFKYDLNNPENAFSERESQYPNYEPIENYVHTLENGLPYLCVEAGGDWECPVVLFVYYDGKKFRSYIPEIGNTYNKDKKSAFGNNDDSDAKFLVGQFIDKKTLNSLSNDECEDIYYELIQEIKPDYKLCLEDFKNRLGL